MIKQLKLLLSQSQQWPQAALLLRLLGYIRQIP